MLRRAHNSMPLAAGPAGAAPQWVQLLPAGTFTGLDGAGPYHNDDPQAVIAATLDAASGVDLPIDYDHQLLWARENGQPALAAGWFKDFEVREGSVWGRVDWTQAAAARIAAREYRYLSPVFLFDPAGRIIRVEHAGLTNVPNLEMQALASRLHNNGGEMKPEQYAALLVSLGLSADTKPDALVANAKTIGDRLKEADVTLAAMSKRLGLPDGSTLRTIENAVDVAMTAVAETAQVLGEAGPVPPARLAACAKALVAKQGQATAGLDPTKHVPMEQFQAVASRLKALEDSQATEKATTAVEAAMQAGKVIPSTKEWAMAYASRDPAGFAAYVAAMPSIVKPGQEGPSGQPPAADGQLGDVDLAVCSRMGLDPEEFKKHRQQEGA
ncbi:phage protease [Solidesulfovibrio sp.]|uniref:phage protease n=1 Tax=Solidesulfovibrio sp. TaxID=2910990 RepID=UPI002B21130F|nr:phage protease [Solidesulfovibrio sp.]MEA5090820.1 phage protease [Solidesulfovibrio sp.]